MQIIADLTSKKPKLNIFLSFNTSQIFNKNYEKNVFKNRNIKIQWIDGIKGHWKERTNT